MIAALIRWSARNVFLIGIATVFVTIAGIYAVLRVPLDAIPDLSDVQVIVYTEYPAKPHRWWRIKSRIRSLPRC